MKIFIIVLTFGAFAFSVFGQNTVTLSGNVVDEQGAAIAGAEVKLVNQSNNLTRKSITNEDGFFTFSQLSPANYVLSVAKTGFAAFERKDLVLNVGDQKSLQVPMKVGEVAATVQVESSLVSDSATVETVTDRQFVENLPLNGRSFQSLISLTPGVNTARIDDPSAGGQFSISGQRTNANYFTVDGVSANIGISAGGRIGQGAAGTLLGLSTSGGTNSLVSVEALQEFKIQTSTFAAEFGRQAGGQIQIVTRSGTNEFRGSVFNYFRNEALDANDFFANRAGLSRAAVRQNDFGGVFGGPILLAKDENGQNRTFFFFSYEGLRLRQPQTGITTTPSVLARNTASVALRPILRAYPTPNGQDFGNGVAEYTASFSNPSQLDATSLRIDHNFNQKFNIFGRYNFAPSETKQRGVGGSTLSGAASNSISIGTIKSRTETLTIGSTQILSNSMSNEFRFNFSRSKASTRFSLDEFGGAVIPADSVFFPSFSSSETGYFNFNAAEIPELNIGLLGENSLRQFNLANNFSVTKGTHALKFGFDYRRIETTALNGNGRFAAFVGFDAVGSPGNAPAGTVQSSIASFVELGNALTVPLAFDNYSFYAQETWRVKQRLTLSYGLRYEINPAPRGRNGLELRTVNDTKNLATLELAPPGTPLFKTTYDNFAPRFGISYLFSNRAGRETVLRGGAGIFYDLPAGRIADLSISFPNYAFTFEEQVPFPLNINAPLQISSNYPIGSLETADRNLKLPRTFQYNIGIEQSFGKNQVFSATYVGAKARRLLRVETYFSPNQNFDLLLLTKNADVSDYNALQLQFERRLTKGFQATASYTWSHSTDTASNDAIIFNTPLERGGNLDRGDSDFDVRHAFNLAATYNLPKLQNGNAFAKAVLNDWAIDGIFTARSALPVNLVAGSVFAGFFARVRPDLVNGQLLYLEDRTAPGGKRFNPAAFIASQNPDGSLKQGNFGRNILRGFSLYQTDLVLRRQFNFSERINLQFRVEAFNLFNRANFANPVNDIRNPLFGQATQTFGRGLGGGGVTGGLNPLYQVGGPRSMQFSLKLNF